MTSSTPKTPLTVAIESADYLDSLAARTFSRGDAKLVANLLSAEQPDSDRERAILAAAIQGNRSSALPSQAIKYSKLKDALDGPLSEEMLLFPKDVTTALGRFARLTKLQHRIFSTWSSPKSHDMGAELFESLTLSELDAVSIGALSDALWVGAPPRERAARIRETAEKTTDQLLRAILDAALEVLRLAEIDLVIEKRRKYLSILNNCANRHNEISPAIMCEIIGAIGMLDADSKNILKSYPVEGALFSYALESVKNIPEGLEGFASLRPTNIVTGELAATRPGYFIVAMNAKELAHAADFATVRNRRGVRGSLLYLSNNPLSASELERLNETFESVAVSHEDINWYLEDPKQRMRYDAALANVKQTTRKHIQGARREAPGLEAYFNHVAEQKLFNAFKREASIWRKLISNSPAPTQIIFMSFEPAVGFLEKCSSGSACIEPLKNELSGVAFIGASPSPQTGINSHNYQRYLRYKNGLSAFSSGHKPKESSAKKDRLTTFDQRNPSSKRFAIFFHPHDQQYLYTAKALAELLSPADYALFTSRECTPAEVELLNGVTYSSLMDAVAGFQQEKNFAEDPATIELDENDPRYCTSDTLHTIEKFNIFEEITANTHKLRLFEEQLVKFFHAQNFTHALFIPERPAIFKMALRVIKQTGVACANVESSIFGDEPVLGEFLAPRHFVIDPTQKEILHRYHKVDEAHIEIGGPAHDYVRGLKPQRRISAETFKARKRILLCTQSDNFEKNARLIEATVAAFDASGLSVDGSITLVIRPHPSEATSRRKSYMALPSVANRDDIQLCMADTFEKSVESARFVVTRYSTVLYDARNDFATPIAVNLSNDPASIDFIGLGVCLGATTTEELARHFQPQNADKVLAAENAFRAKLKSGIDDPARHILKTMGASVRDGKDG